MFVSVLNWLLEDDLSCPKSSPLVLIFRATLSRKLTALFCRLPLPTLIYWPEASHLGDLLRLLVRPVVVLLWLSKTLCFSFLWFSWINCTPLLGPHWRGRSGYSRNWKYSFRFRTSSQVNPNSEVLRTIIQRSPVEQVLSNWIENLLKGKEISSRGHNWYPKGCLELVLPPFNINCSLYCPIDPEVAPQINETREQCKPQHGYWNINQFPFQNGASNNNLSTSTHQWPYHNMLRWNYSTILVINRFPP